MAQTPQTRMEWSLDDSSNPLRSNSIMHRLAALLCVRKQPQTRLLKQVESLQLGPKRAVYLVECDGMRFLIAAGGDSMSAPVPLTQHVTMRDNPAEKEPPQ